MAEPRWLKLARVEIGTHEVAGEHDNPAVMAYYRDAGHPEIQHDETAWCAGFFCAMLERAGEHSPKTLSAREVLRWGKKLDKPKIGCACVFSRGNPRSYQGHVGFYCGEEDGCILLLAGNQGDAVSIEKVSKARLLGYRWPVQASNSRTTKAVVAGVAGIVVSGADAVVTTATHVASTVAASPDQVVKIGSELKGMGVPWLMIAGSILTMIALGAIAWAHYSDLQKNGK